MKGLSMPISIRPLTPDDATTVVTVIANSLGDSVQNVHIEQVMAGDNRASFVAVYDGQVIGFVDGFLTIAQNGTRRWELDLLGVQPDFHGRGAGKKLIETFTDAAKQYDATLVRALVATDNTSMQTAMTKTGYQRLPDVYELHIASAEGKAVNAPENAYLIPVNTFTYRGIWLEGHISQQAIDAANTIRTNHDWDVVGAVISQNDIAALDTVRAAEFTLIKTFHWWHYSI
jgi:GNAT superfamily N-acetyltransferase